MNKTVLVVDDDDVLRDTLCESLIDAGYLAIPAQDGQAALDYLQKNAAEPPCMILLDLMMPVMNGWQFLEARRKLPAILAIAVVVMTATSAIEADALQNVSEFLRKPLRLATLLDTTRRFCPC